MPGRYAIVDEPEALEITDDDVYHPDQSIRSEPTSSVRSLEPIVAGPLNLRDIFYDGRWSLKHKKICLGCYAIIALFCLSLLISLFVGLGHVLTYIDYVKLMRSQGVAMIPDLEAEDITTFIHSVGKDSHKIWGQYVHEINGLLNEYETSQNSSEYGDCSNDKGFVDRRLCKVDIMKSLQTLNCTNETNYGFNHGKPCILFKFHKVTNYKPTLVDKKMAELPFKCKTDILSNPGLSYNYSTPSGFGFQYFPTRTVKGKDQMAPLVVVRLDPELTQTATISCGVDTTIITNKSAFKGAWAIKFEFQTASNIMGE